LENNRREMQNIMKEFKNMSNKILEHGESLVKSNVTTNDVNAMSWTLEALSQGYGFLKKYFEKSAAPQNSVVSNLNSTNIRGTIYKDNNKLII